MASIKFAFGDNVGLNQRDALDLADLLSKERSLAGQSASRKVREQAERDPDRAETSHDVDLSPDELIVLHDLLNALPSEQMSDAMRRVRDEVGGVRDAD